MAKKKKFDSEKGLYDGKFFENMKDAYLRGETEPWTKLRLSHIEKLVEPKKGQKIIDLGCAAGAITHFCSGFGMDALGIDFSEQAVELAKKTFNGKNISFLQRNVGDLHGLKNNSFDKAVAADLVEHISQEIFESMCKELKRVLKKGGTVSIYTPNPKHVIEIMKKHNFIIKQNPTHTGLKTKKELVDTLKKNGFEIDVCYFAPSHFKGWNIIESSLKNVPGLGKYFGYRICIRAVAA